MYQRILVALDDSASAQRALGEALELAKVGAATVRLVHAVGIAPQRNDPAGTEFTTTRDLLLKGSQAALDQAAARAQQAGVVAEVALIELRTSEYGKAVLDEAQRWAADLIVMGTHGRTGLAHLLLGSVAESVVRRASVPVLLVRSTTASG